MKNTFLTLASAAAVFLAVAQNIQAVPITGNIGFSGSVQLNTGDVTTATTAVNWFGTQITPNSTSGSFLTSFGSIGGQSVTMAAPWQFSLGGPLASFWSVGGYTFNLSSSSAFVQVLGNQTFLNIVLTGTVSAVGFDTTAFSGTFQVANPPANGIATFTERLSFNSVPDGGTTVMLLGAALSGMALIKRKFMS
jgi:hypothetical protein